MNDYSRAGAIPAGRADMSVDAGLRAFMLGVYNKMALGLVWSALLAYAVGTYAPLTQLVFGTPLLYVVQWGPLALLLGSTFLMRNPSPTGASVLYWAVVTLIGTGLGVWVFLATGSQAVTSLNGATKVVTFDGIAKAFLVTSLAFGGLSLWGYTTKKDLTGFGSFLVMAMWGLLAVGLVNFALASFFNIKSTALELGMQLAGLVIFSGLIAFQTQALKYSYYEMGGDSRSLAVATTMGALNLYIAFINLFQILLSLFSSRD